MVNLTILELGALDGKTIKSFNLKSREIEVELTNYGASILSIKVPDNTGKMTDVVLGYKNIEDYFKSDKFLGATVGRSANRIKGGIAEIKGEKIQLSLNDGGNHIHGGFVVLIKKFGTIYS